MNKDYNWTHIKDELLNGYSQYLKLCEKELLVLYDDNGRYSYKELQFHEDNYSHLTGLQYFTEFSKFKDLETAINKNNNYCPNLVYLSHAGEIALNNKIPALTSMHRLCFNIQAIGNYYDINNEGIDFMISSDSTKNVLLGFKECYDENLDKKYCVPSSLQKTDFKNRAIQTKKVLAVLSREHGEDKYNNICKNNVPDGMTLPAKKFSESLKQVIEPDVIKKFTDPTYSFKSNKYEAEIFYDMLNRDREGYVSMLQNYPNADEKSKELSQEYIAILSEYTNDNRQIKRMFNTTSLCDSFKQYSKDVKINPNNAIDEFIKNADSFKKENLYKTNIFSVIIKDEGEVTETHEKFIDADLSWQAWAKACPDARVELTEWELSYLRNNCMSGKRLGSRVLVNKTLNYSIYGVSSLLNESTSIKMQEQLIKQIKKADEKSK